MSNKCRLARNVTANKNKTRGDTSDYYLDATEYVDLGTDLTKFRDSAGKPVDITD